MCAQKVCGASDLPGSCCWSWMVPMPSVLGSVGSHFPMRAIIETKASDFPPYIQGYSFTTYIFISIGFWFQPDVSLFKLPCFPNISISVYHYFCLNKSNKEPPHVRTSLRQEISLSRVVSKDPRNFALSVRLCLAFLVIWPLRNDKMGTLFLGFLSSLWRDICRALHLPSEMFLEMCLVYHSLCLHRAMAQVDGA